MITLRDIEIAATAIAPAIRETPMVHSQNLSALTNADVYLKLEQLQLSGAFKLRGASNAVSQLSDEQKAAGVVGVSTGNHGRGLARACKTAGVECVICMSSLVPQNKIDAIKGEGARIFIEGRSQDDAEVVAQKLVDEKGMTMLPPFDHPHIIAGQGTLGLEIFEQMPDVETVLVPLSGGGLISGVALGLKSRNPKIKIVGVTMERGAAMYECIKADKYVEVEELPTLADSLGGGIGKDNQYTFNMVRDLVDEYILVNEEDIANAIRHAYWQEGQVLEGSGSVSIAAVLSGKFTPLDKTVLLCSGGNIDINMHQRIVGGEEIKL